MNSFETLRKIIDNNVTNRVDHVAFRLLGKTYTNQFLAEESKRIEALLHASLTSPVTSSGQIRVGVCLGRNQYFLPAFYTLLRNGYTYIPLDPDLPEDRMNYIIEDSQMNLILTTPDLVHKFKTCQIVDVTAKATEVHLGERPANQPHLAYIMFTSGTTGKPKGVPISYDNLLYFLQCIDDELHYLGSDGRVLFFTSIGFDVSICEIMGSLYSGSTLCIATEDIRSDGGQLYQFINQEQITYACLTPSLMNILPSMEFSHMKVLQSVGEPMIAKVAEKGTGKNYLFVDSYGPTEATVFCFSKVIDATTSYRNIGRPYSSTSFHVVDADMQELPVDEIGELMLAGHQLCEGYLNRPELNREKFVPNPFDDHDEFPVLYHTGDLVKRHADGTVEFLGRMDSQIKLHGFRIELDEIRSHLEAEPDVKQALVRLENFGKSLYIVAYIEPTHQPFDLAPVKTTLKEQLPHYMIPTYWVVVDKFSRNINGKIDRNALHNPYYESYTHNTRPLNEKEAMIASVVSRIMGIEDVNVNVDLIDELGFSSLQIMEAVPSLGFKSLYISAKDFYDYRTVEEIAKNYSRKPHYWFNEPDKNKPTLLVVSGYTSFNFLYTEFANGIADKWNIYVIESYFETSGGKVLTTEQTVEDYFQMIEPVLKEYGIPVITGFCLGGELGMYLAYLIYQRYGLLPYIVALDCEILRHKDRSKMMQPNFVYFTQAINDLHYDIEMTLIETFPDYIYPGRITVFLSKYFDVNRVSFNETDPMTDEQKYWAQKSFDDTPGNWQKVYPECDIHYLEVEHLQFLRTENSIKPLVDFFHQIEI